MSDKQIPKYMRLKEEIGTWLDSGRLQAGDQVPSENEIADQFQMSRQTVRQALGELEQEGRLYRVQGKGTFVSGGVSSKTADNQTIGIITTYISDYIFPHIVRGAESALRDKGYRMLLSSTDNDKEKEKESLQMMLSQPLSGLIIEPTRSAAGNPNLGYYLSLDYERVPYLMINERYPEMNCPFVKMDDEDGGFQAAEHLIRLGHRRIAVFYKSDDLQGVQRLKGFMRAHRHYGVPLIPELVIPYTTEEKGTKPYKHALRLLEAEAMRPTAFVCYNDELAIILLEATRQLGLQVPHDISIVGFDDSTLATATEVKLTTLSHPKMKMGVDAAKLLVEMIEHKRMPSPDRICYKPELIVRESTGPVR